MWRHRLVLGGLEALTDPRLFSSISSRMGIVFGKTGSKEPEFSIIKSYEGFEVRKYPALCVAEVPTHLGAEDPKGNKGFSVLAKYIGVFGTPSNESKQPMAMTAPVIMTEPATKALAMKAPVLNSESGSGDAFTSTMSFVMPFHETMDTLPTPTDERVTLKTIPAKIVAVRQFSGWYSHAEGKKQHAALMKDLVENDLYEAPASSSGPNANANASDEKNRPLLDAAAQEEEFTVAQYHPPFTLGFLRRNEIWFEIQASHPEVQRMIKEHLQEEEAKTSSD